MITWLRRLRARLRYRHFDRDLTRELEIHREMKTRELEATGLSGDDARRRAALDIGNVTLAREEARRVWIAPWLESLWQDLRQAVTLMRRQPLFSAGVVLILAIGTGLVTVIFTFAHATFLRPWPARDPLSIVVFQTRRPPPPPPSAAPAPTIRLAPEFSSISIPEFRYLETRARSVDHLAVSVMRGSWRLERRAGELVARPLGAYVSSRYFDLAGLPMMAGRGFRADEDDDRNPAAVAVLSERLWRRSFDADPAIVGATLLFNARPTTVVGIAPKAFLDRNGSQIDVWTPLASSALDGQAARLTNPRAASGSILPIGRLARGASPETAVAELEMLGSQFRIAESLPAVKLDVFDTRPISRRGIREETQITFMVFGALMLVLLLACANVGNLLLARALGRQREVAIRLALGAGRARIVRQLITEAAVLATVAGLGAYALSYVVPIVMRRSGEWAGERSEFYAPDATVFWFAIAMSAVTTLACGLAPALRATRVSVTAGASRRHGVSGGTVRLRRGLLAVQIALATVLLTGAGLLARGIDHGLAIEPGFALRDTQAITIAHPAGTPAERRTAFFRELAGNLGSSGAPLVAFTDEPPLSETNYVGFVRHPGQSKNDTVAITARPVSQNYFDVLGIRLVVGRPPRPDAGRGELVLSESAARLLWPGENPIGRTLEEGLDAPLTPHEVVGIAVDVHARSLVRTEPVVYTSTTFYRPTLLVRDLSPAVVDRIRTAALAIDPRVTVASRPLADDVRDMLQVAIIAGRIAWAVGALGLLLAAFGAFGVFSYAVEQRRREIGIRLALGARASQIVRMVLHTTQRTVIAGLVIGVALAAVMAPLLRRYLYGLSPHDPIAYLQIAAVLLAAAAIATWLPARRATRVDPAVTLRSE